MANSSFAGRIIRWQKKQGRHGLPWQNMRDPYRIWIAEIMLQQTQVQTVIPYYRKFMKRFPNLRTLAGARPDRVMAAWAGLGYYSRARNLYKAAILIEKKHEGAFPDVFDEIRALPGIGRSTAGAIAVFAFDLRYPILDGNVKRVLARYFGVSGIPDAPETQKKLWALSESLLPKKSLQRYTQGIMDIGAIICVRSKPRCGQCPLRAGCLARKKDMAAELPGKKERKALPVKKTRMLIFRRKGKILLFKRPDRGIWGGLWSLPEVPVNSDVKLYCRKKWGITVSSIKHIEPISHSFTHFSLSIFPALCTVSGIKSGLPGHAFLWEKATAALRIGVPAPVKSLISSL